MRFIVIIMGYVEHGNRDSNAMLCHTIERADEIKELAEAAGLEASVLLVREQLDAESIIEAMAAA